MGCGKSSGNQAMVYPCVKCKKNVGNNDDALQCDQCQHWVHGKCAGWSEEAYSILKELPRFRFFCADCLPAIDALRSLKGVGELLADMEARFDQRMSRLEATLASRPSLTPFAAAAARAAAPSAVRVGAFAAPLASPPDLVDVIKATIEVEAACPRPRTTSSSSVSW